MTNPLHRNSLSDEPPVKCLLVDDRPENLLSLSALLADSGVEILTARSGHEALELALVHDLALALLDVQMPVMDGFELAELLRGTERTRRIPLIFVTAGAHDQSRMFKGYDAGAVDFLFKPIEPRILQSKTRVFFELYRAKRRLARDLAERSETLRLNETFSAILGHDLRSPLSAMQLGALVIQRTSTDPAAQEKAGAIVESGKRMGRMISDLLDLSRARLAGGIPMAPEPASAQDIVQSVVAEQLSARPDLILETAFNGDMAVEWDSDRIAQLLSNLVGNAALHGAQGRPVRVAVDGGDSDAVVVSVSNEGRIPEAVRGSIFEPFRSREHAGPREGLGLGLGLFIVQQIAVAHGGTVEVDDREAADSTCILVTLPRRGKAGYGVSAA